MSPTISVIIPAYNAARTIAESLATLRAQTWDDWEAIVIDDGSSDGTWDVVVALAQAWRSNIAQEEPRLRIIASEGVRSGPSAARNRGLAVARGRAIAFLDADDGWTADKLAHQWAVLQATPAAGWVYSWSDYVAERVDEGARLLYPGFRRAIAGWVYGELLTNNFIENGSNPLVWATALQRVAGPRGIFDETLRQAEDWDLWLRLAREFEVAVVPRRQVRYRVTAESSSTDLGALEAGCWRVLNQHLALPPPTGLDRRTLQRIGGRARGRICRGLACKALTAGRAGRSLGLLGRSLWHDPRLLREGKFLAVMGVKIGLAIVLGPGRGEAVWEKVKGGRA